LEEGKYQASDFHRLCCKIVFIRPDKEEFRDASENLSTADLDQAAFLGCSREDNGSVK